MGPILTCNTVRQKIRSGSLVLHARVQHDATSLCMPPRSDARSHAAPRGTNDTLLRPQRQPSGRATLQFARQELPTEQASTGNTPRTFRVRTSRTALADLNAARLHHRTASGEQQQQHQQTCPWCPFATQANQQVPSDRRAAAEAATAMDASEEGPGQGAAGSAAAIESARMDLHARVEVRNIPHAQA